MRILTREWFSWAPYDEEREDAGRQWLEDRQLIRPALHSGAEKLIDVDVHDGVIDVLRQVEGDVVELRALIGDSQIGYEWLYARYLGATLSVVETGFGEAGTEFEMLGDELTAQDGAFVHSVITWPRGEFDIEFAAVELTFTPAGGEDRMALFTREESPNASTNQ